MAAKTPFFLLAPVNDMRRRCNVHALCGHRFLELPCTVTYLRCSLSRLTLSVHCLWLTPTSVQCIKIRSMSL